MKKGLITICARGGSKGVPGKNIREFMGKPLIAHTIEQALDWNEYSIKEMGFSSELIVSTDSEEIQTVARKFGAKTPFLRPSELATDSAGKIPVLTHALISAEKIFNAKYDFVIDLDPTSPVRSRSDILCGWKKFNESDCDVVLSVVQARKNPYFNVLERGDDGKIKPVKSLSASVVSRQSAPQVWDANASIYFYKSEFLRKNPKSIWDGKLEIFEMPPESSFDIDEERDFLIAETLMKWGLAKKPGGSL